MKEKDLIRALRALQQIEPEKDYTKESRLLVLSSFKHNPLEATASLVSQFNPATVWHAPLRIGSFLAVIALLVGGIYYSTTQLSPLFLPGLNQEKIVAEADMIERTINVELQQLEHFSYVATESNEALEEVSVNQADHLHTATLEKEADAIDRALPQESVEISEELNQLLNTISQ
jgi:hypothetical protein